MTRDLLGVRWPLLDVLETPLSEERGSTSREALGHTHVVERVTERDGRGTDTHRTDGAVCEHDVCVCVRVCVRVRVRVCVCACPVRPAALVGPGM